MDNYIDISKFPRRENGSIIWSGTVGITVPFRYFDLEGEVTVISENSKKSTVTIDYKGTHLELMCNSLRNCRFNKLVQKLNEVHIGDEFPVKSGILKVNSVRHVGNNVICNFTCSNCKYTGDIPVHRLRRIKECPCCGYRARRVVKEINSLWKERPELVKYFENEEESYEVTVGDSSKKWMKCPVCGDRKLVRIDILTRDGFICNSNKCSKYGSYPNKIMKAVLDLQQVDYKPEKTFEWSHYIDPNGRQTSKRYDFYLPKHKIIIEMHGIQHYEETDFTSDSLKDIQENDSLKKQMALASGDVEHYITIDARVSEFDFIYNNIKESMLPQLIIWKELEESSIKEETESSILNKVADLYNQGFDARSISEKLKIGMTLTYRKLALCRELKLCNYIPYEHKRRPMKKKIKEQAV